MNPRSKKAPASSNSGGAAEKRRPRRPKTATRSDAQPSTPTDYRAYAATVPPWWGPLRRSFIAAENDVERHGDGLVLCESPRHPGFSALAIDGAATEDVAAVGGGLLRWPAEEKRPAHRPPDAGVARDAVLMVRVTEAEKQTIKNAAQGNVSEWCRRVLMEAAR